MSKTGFIIATVLLAAVLVGGIVILFSGSKSAPTDTSDQKTANTAQQTQSTTQATTETAPATDTTAKPADLKVEVLKQGTGSAVTKAGDTISVNYTGTLTNGTQFDSSIGKQPFSFTLGSGQVIKGWDQGLVGLKVGEKVKLTIPPSLGYGAQAMGDKIPANSTLIFEVDILGIK